MNMASPRFFFLVLLIASFSSLNFGATLPDDEVKALEGIAKTLGMKNWNSSVAGNELFVGRNSCSDLGPRADDVVICNCSDAVGTLCHVTSFCFKRQSLPGQLPLEFVRLPYLREIDLYGNYLNGTIPKEWGSMNLTIISLGGNRLTGSIPPEIGNISSLQELILEFNQLSENIPHVLGNLSQLQRLYLNSNNFTGELPPTLAKLTSLHEIQLGDNQFSGKIPDFIQNWTSLQRLVIQGSGLSGPIPSGISLLRNLTDLRISDLSGDESSPFPQLNMTSLQHVILRSCNISGKLPDYNIEDMLTLKTLDLSFNKLTGPIPLNYASLSINIYLTENLLSGSQPSKWKGKAVDLSYNDNFSIASQGSETCPQDGKLNLFASTLTSNDSGKVISCLRSSDCSETSNSLYINCGGNSVLVNETTYDEDTIETGAAMFYHNKNWALSSTGDYLDNSTNKIYITSNNSKLSMSSTNAELYTRARISPISLTYYGFCLENGSYTVNLHFAEIMFTDDQTYSSLGRRVFDIYIQGNLVHKDFNIAEEAGGVGKAITKPFTTTVTNNTLEIRFYWAGKGTTAIPYKGVYGPLISAISAKLENGRGIPAGAVVGIVAAVLAIIIILVFGILWWKGFLGKKNSLTREPNGLEIQTNIFSLRQIKAATNNFAITNKIGEGGFGPVYKGCLPDGTIIAVKQLSSRSKQGTREFLNENGMISALQHPCLVKLYGCCVEENQLLLVYEYLENNSLARALFGPEQHQIRLDWPTRQKICVGIARGLAYLHEESRLKVVHRDIKATNVLLDKDLNPKISDFGLAKLDEEDNTHISTRIAGTYGYMAPEYAMHGHLTDKADVYSFGIVALEIVSGRTNTTLRQKEEAFYLLDWARLLKEKGNLMELVDIRLGSNFNEEEVMVMIKVALLCTNMSPTLRPNMSSVVSMLEGKTVVEEQVSESSELLDEKKLEAMRQYYYQKQSISTDQEPLTSSSTSAADLYPVKLDSSYFDGRG